MSLMGRPATCNKGHVLLWPTRGSGLNEMEPRQLVVEPVRIEQSATEVLASAGSPRDPTSRWEARDATGRSVQGMTISGTSRSTGYCGSSCSGATPRRRRSRARSRSSVRSRGSPWRATSRRSDSRISRCTEAAAASCSSKIKESDEDTTKNAWRPTDKKFRGFMARAASRPYNPDRRCLFLTSGTFHDDVRKLLGDATQLAAYHDKFPKRKPLPAVAASIANWLQVDVCEFIEATPVDSAVASAGIGAAIINLLDSIGVANPQAAYTRLRHEVAVGRFESLGRASRTWSSARKSCACSASRMARRGAG